VVLHRVELSRQLGQRTIHLGLRRFLHTLVGSWIRIFVQACEGLSVPIPPSNVGEPLSNGGDGSGRLWQLLSPARWTLRADALGLIPPVAGLKRIPHHKWQLLWIEA
jgi:hypothetical protein